MSEKNFSAAVCVFCFHYIIASAEARLSEKNKKIPKKFRDKEKRLSVKLSLFCCSVPVRGVSCSRVVNMCISTCTTFPSPCGGELQRDYVSEYIKKIQFPSPCGGELQQIGTRYKGGLKWFPSPRGGELQQ